MHVLHAVRDLKLQKHGLQRLSNSLKPFVGETRTGSTNCPAGNCLVKGTNEPSQNLRCLADVIIVIIVIAFI